jgi:hypothetical protein
MTQVIYCAISKPRISIEDWILLRKSLAPKTRTGGAGGLKESPGEFVLTGELSQLVHPRDLAAETLDEAFFLAFQRGRSPRGLLAKVDSLSAALSDSLKGETGEESSAVSCFVFVPEFGSLVLLSLISFNEAAPASCLSQPFVRRFIEVSFNKTHSTLATNCTREVTQNLLGLELIADFERSFTYLTGIFSERAASLTDIGAVHRIEESNDADETDELSLGELGVIYAKVGWSHSTFVTRDLGSTLFVLPPIVAVDSLYAITSVQNDELLRNGLEIQKIRSLSEITASLAAYQNRKFNVELLDLERKRLEEQFKPWQRGVYWKLFHHWGMKDSIETLSKIHQLTLEACNQELSEVSARIQSRQNKILGWIALVQFAGIGQSILAYFDLFGHGSVNDSALIYKSWVYFLFAAGLPFAVAAFLVLMSRLYFLKN